MRDEGRRNSVWHRQIDYDEPYRTERLPSEAAYDDDDDSMETESVVIPTSMMSMSSMSNIARKKRKKWAMIALVSPVALFAIALGVGLGTREGNASNISAEGGMDVAECEELLAKAKAKAMGGGHNYNMPSSTAMMPMIPTSASVPTAVRGRPGSVMRFSDDVSDIKSLKLAEKMMGGSERDDDHGWGGRELRDGAERRLRCEKLLDDMLYNNGKFTDHYDETLLAFNKSELADDETENNNATNTTLSTDNNNATNDNATNATSSPTPTVISNTDNEPPTTPPKAATMSEPTVFFPSPTCTGVFSCLQNSDFHEVDDARYNIDLSLELLDHSHSHAYATARTKWMNVITGDLPPSSSPSVGVSSTDDVDIDRCINDLPEIIDDLHICGRDMEYDGRGGVVGAAGPLFLRRDPITSRWTTLVGQMRFDVADVATLASYGIWEDVILHEMGHVIGIGTLWYLNGLVDRWNLEYRGPNAIRVWRNDWGCDASDAPPVEKDGRPGDGTYGGHWDERCLHDEFMTGSANYGRNPISTLTVASIEDLGYEVDYDAADAYNGTDTYCCHGGNEWHSPWSRRRLGGNRDNARPPPRGDRSGARSLSATGRAAAVAHGREVLQRRQKRPGSGGDDNGNDHGGWSEANMVTETMFSITEGAASSDVRYVGDQLVVVLYEEEGHIYDLFVTSEEE